MEMDLQITKKVFGNRKNSSHICIKRNHITKLTHIFK